MNDREHFWAKSCEHVTKQLLTEEVYGMAGSTCRWLGSLTLDHASRQIRLAVHRTLAPVHAARSQPDGYTRELTLRVTI